VKNLNSIFQNWLQKFKEKLIQVGNPAGPIFDNREEHSGLITYVRSLGLPWQEDMLIIGDVAISGRKVIEIKRITKKSNDLRQSLFDNRLYPQAEDRRANYDVSLMLVELHKGVNPFDEYFTKDQWDSLIISLAIDFNTTTLQTETPEETIQMIYEAWIKEVSGPHYVSPCNKKPKPKSLLDQQRYFLSGLIDVGDKNTLELIKLFRTPINVIAHIIDTQVTFTKGGNPRRPENAPEGYGASFYHKNQAMLLKIPEEKKESTTPDKTEKLKNEGDKNNV